MTGIRVGAKWDEKQIGANDYAIRGEGGGKSPVSML